MPRAGFLQVQGQQLSPAFFQVLNGVRAVQYGGIGGVADVGIELQVIGTKRCSVSSLCGS